jgi:hypothetical protein
LISNCKTLPPGSKYSWFYADDENSDIVDTVHCDGNVWKMFFGSLDKDFDEDQAH